MGEPAHQRERTRAHRALLGAIELFWAPKILEEVGRVRLWIWIKKALRRGPAPAGSSAWKALWSRYSEEAHSWFARISPLVQVIEDQPPHEPAWADPHPDPNDAWLWNTARRVDADLVVTVNLRDGPPPDVEGTRQHERIAYIHPEALTVFLDVWSDIFETGLVPEDLVGEIIRGGARFAKPLNAQTLVVLVRAILAKIAEENAAEQT